MNNDAMTLTKKWRKGLPATAQLTEFNNCGYEDDFLAGRPLVDQIRLPSSWEEERIEFQVV